MGWSTPQPKIFNERPAIFVDRESMWSPQTRLLRNRGYLYTPVMNPEVGPMLKDISGNVVIYDYFIRDGYFYMISTYTSEGSPELTVTINDTVAEAVGYQEYMPTRHYKCACPDTGIVWVTINGTSYELLPDIIKPLAVKKRFGIVLNFKHESAAWIRRFLDYYRKQGADAFYFYYNGSVMPPGLPQGSDIKYRLWDCKFKIFDNRFIHGAQTMAYSSFRWRYYDDCVWVAAIDLDEFICDINEKGRVVDLLSKMDCDVVMINNFWATVKSEGGPIRYSMHSCGFNFDNGRTKCIFNTQKYRGEWGIHLPKASCKMIKSKLLIFLHIVDCLHPERANMLLEPTAITHKIRLAKL